MKEKNKGFTLVELLAVIVILALIALIATPIILNVVSNGEVEKVSTTKKIENGTAVYYNPETGKKCESSESKSTTGTKSGCMKWYVFNDKEGNATVNVILDHNTTARVAWNSTGNNSEMKEVKKALENDTGTWKNTARLITANEIAKITEKTGFDASKKNQDWFCLDTNQPDTTSYCAKAQGKSKYAWLFDYTYECTNYGCNTSDLSTWGYWTSTSSWHVSRFGHLSNTNANYADSGVRPVITISKANI
jgi:prepilin-type N-terminal cleavage/methylation domain-containing protein